MKFSLLKYASTAVAASALMLSGCGGDVTEVTETVDLMGEVLDPRVEMPTCDRNSEGDIIYSTDSAKTYVCALNRWIILNGEDGEDGADGRNGKPGAQGAQGETGDPGDGCSAKNIVSEDSSRTGFVVSCGDSPADTLWNGVDGKDGKNGKNGKNGAAPSFASSCELNPIVSDDSLKRTGLEIVCDTTYIDTLWNGVNGVDGGVGEKGETGSSCSSTPFSLENGKSGFVLTCGEALPDTIWNGADGKDGLPGSKDSVCKFTAVLVDGRSGLEIACRDAVDTLWNGLDGQNGKDGLPGVGCSYTPFSLDDGASGVEIVCGEGSPDTLWNGKDGTPGMPGNGGANGKDCVVESDSYGVVVVACQNDAAIQRDTLYKYYCGTIPYDPATETCENGNLKSSFVDTFEDVLADGEEADYTAKTYAVVRIGNQLWMDNMRRKNVASKESGDNVCGGWNDGGNNVGDCNNRGRLYKWVSTENLCPDGWRLPSRDDWMELFTSVDASATLDESNVMVFAENTITHLKANRVWQEENRGDDLWGFDFIPSGYTSGGMGTNGTGDGYYWTSEESVLDGDVPAAWTLHLTSTGISFALVVQTNAQSVRCVKNVK